MAVLKTILHKKNSSGSYDDVYVRTRADNVLLTDNSTLLSAKLSSMDTTIAGKAASNHNHSGVYAPVSHTHAASEITGLGSSSIKLAKINVSKSSMTNSNIDTYIWSSSSLGTILAYMVLSYSITIYRYYRDEESDYTATALGLYEESGTNGRYTPTHSGFHIPYTNYTDEGCLSICAQSGGSDWAGIAFTTSGIYNFGYYFSASKYYP